MPEPSYSAWLQGKTESGRTVHIDRDPYVDTTAVVLVDGVQPVSVRVSRMRDGGTTNDRHKLGPHPLAESDQRRRPGARASAHARRRRVAARMSVDKTDDGDRVETQAVIHEVSGDIRVRRNDIEGIWLKPANGLDNDGEHHLTIAHLGRALQVLGFNHADLFPDG